MYHVIHPGWEASGNMQISVFILRFGFLDFSKKKSFKANAPQKVFL